MEDNILPASVARANIYETKNFEPLKVLLPDGRVVSYLQTSPLNSLVPESYDRIECSYTGNNLTGVVYIKDSVVVATLVLSYDISNNLTAVQRT